MKTNKGTPEVSELRPAGRRRNRNSGRQYGSLEMSPDKMKALIHELRVHQIELQIPAK